MTKEFKAYNLFNNRAEHLGDGVYAIDDGHGGIWLHANDHEHPTDRIYLDTPVFEALVRFKEQGEATDPLTVPTDEQVRKDNPHFGPTIRVVEEVRVYQEQEHKNYSHVVTMGAYKGRHLGETTEDDAWAIYLYHSASRRWVLGGN